MTLGIRKAIVLGVVGGIFLVANALVIAHWLSSMGAVEMAVDIRKEFLTGTAITIIIALLILLVSPRAGGAGLIKSCPVCDHRILGRGKYCSECGSRA